MRHAAYLGVRGRAPQRLRINDLSCCTLYEVRAAESHERCAFDHENHIGERGKICSACYALTHHCGDLWNVQIAPHDRVVVEDARCSVLAREDTALIRQVHARRVDQVNNRDPAAHCDLLRPKNFLDRLRPPRSRFHARVVRNDDCLPTVYSGDGCHNSGRRSLPVVLIVGHEKPDLEHARPFVAEELHSLARREFPLLMQLLQPFGAARFADPRLERFHLFAQLAQPIAHYASCFSRVANHSLMYSISSVVGVPGPKSRPIPRCSSASTSSFGMIPPPVMRMSSRPCARTSS